MATNTYTADANGEVYAGRFNRITGIAEGGTVVNLAADVTASGFTLLSTAPVGTTIYRNQPHAGSAWDEQRHAMWIWGAETHSIERDYDNSVYCFDTKDGLFKKMYNQSPWPSEYNISADGYLYADDAETLPWAAHTYQRLRYDSSTKELIIPVNTEFHAFTTPIQKGDIDLSSSKRPIWKYNTNTKLWSKDWDSQVELFVRGSSPTNGVAYSDVWGYVGSTDQLIIRLSIDGVYSSTSVSGKINSKIHDAALFSGDNFIKLGQVVADTGTVLSVHPMNDLSLSYRVLKENHPILSGWHNGNKPAAVMPDGRIIFIAQNDSNQIAAFIYDIALDVFTDTGYRLNNATGTYATYNFKAEWSDTLNGLILAADFYGTPLQMYLLRL